MTSYLRIAGLLSLAVALAQLSPTAALAGIRADREFTAQERVRLDAGELVTRPRSQRRGGLNLTGGTSFQVIDATPEVVWAALLDTSSYRHTMPRVTEARVVGERPDRRTLFMRHGAKGLIERSYYLNLKFDADRRDITFVIDASRPHDVKAAWGFYTVRPYDADSRRTILSYGVMADVGGGLLTRLAGSSVQRWMLRPPNMLKSYLERVGNRR